MVYFNISFNYKKYVNHHFIFVNFLSILGYLESKLMSQKNYLDDFLKFEFAALYQKYLSESEDK